MKILDTTIRDGSYSVNFKFTCDTVRKVCAKLENLGFELIEIGHGMGLCASNEKNGTSLHTDLEYMQAARSVLRKSEFGFFCIPGIATLDSLKVAKDNGVSFVRVGANVDEIESTEPYIRTARELGMTVMANYMKSYALSPNEFAENVKLSEKYGAQYVYVVDSAGSMLPKTITEYYKAIRNNSDIKIGFHAHDNLGLAVSNSLHCAELGFDLIDTSLQGIGRSSGNAATELTVMALLRMGFNEYNINIPELLDSGYDSLKNVTYRNLRPPLDMVCGYSEFHTSYMSYIKECSLKYNVSPIELIIEYTKTDKIGMNIEVLEEIAQKLNTIDNVHKYDFSSYFGKEQG